MIRQIEILKIQLEKQPLIKYYVIKHLILLSIQNMMHINAYLLQWFINFLMKSLSLMLLKAKLFRTKNWQQNYTNHLVEILEDEKYNNLKIFGLLI